MASEAAVGCTRDTAIRSTLCLPGSNGTSALGGGVILSVGGSGAKLKLSRFAMSSLCTSKPPSKKTSSFSTMMASPPLWLPCNGVFSSNQVPVILEKMTSNPLCCLGPSSPLLLPAHEAAAGEPRALLLGRCGDPNTSTLGGCGDGDRERPERLPRRGESGGDGMLCEAHVAAAGEPRALLLLGRCGDPNASVPGGCCNGDPDSVGSTDRSSCTGRTCEPDSPPSGSAA